MSEISLNLGLDCSGYEFMNTGFGYPPLINRATFGSVLDNCDGIRESKMYGLSIFIRPATMSSVSKAIKCQKQSQWKINNKEEGCQLFGLTGPLSQKIQQLNNFHLPTYCNAQKALSIFNFITWK